ncbi:MAG: hypothetical protein KJP24_04240 [Sulfurovum sp.]|nr:hypothetical protein [Sulfurovum sp.]
MEAMTIKISQLLIVLLLCAFHFYIARADTEQVTPESGYWATTALIFSDPDERGFLKEVLTSLKLPYKEFVNDMGVNVQWESYSREQELEIQNRVSQYAFIKKHCKGIDLPMPSQPTRDNLSCP